MSVVAALSKKQDSCGGQEAHGLGGHQAYVYGYFISPIISS